MKNKMQEQRESLPIFPFKQDLIAAIREYQILVVVGDTGSGKTTQLPQYILEGIPDAIVAVTQPRRIAAISAAYRVAEETGTKIGDLVGYSIRFEKVASKNTKLQFLTDGTLLRTCTTDPLISQFNCIMLDESHERSLDTDVLFGLLKRACKQRPELKVIIMSATLDIEKFQDFFDAPVFSVPGRMFEVDVLWQKTIKFQTLKTTFVQRCVETVMHIHKTEGPGDVLVFLTGQQEIERCTKNIQDLHKELNYNLVRHRDSVKDMVVYPIYSSLETLQQKAIFEKTPKGVRKIVLATNIAQTSVTVPGIRYVVDCGFVKQKMYDHKTHMDALLVVPISQAAATQRAGRAGRTENGKVYRLYCKEAFQEMSPTTVPEIQRSSLLGTILYLLKIGIKDVLNFDFIDAPDPELVQTGLKQLFYLGAVDKENRLTHLGKIMSDFPVSPFLSRCLISSSQDFQCSDEMCTIVALLSVEDFYIQPRSEKDQALAEEKRQEFYDSSGDHITFLNIYNAWRDSGYSQDWCRDNFFHYRALNVAKNIRSQLLSAMKQHKLEIYSLTHKQKIPPSCRQPILKSLCSGFYMNTVKKQKGKTVFYPYIASLEGQSTLLFLSPQSSLTKIDQDRLDWVIFNDVQFVTRPNMRITSRIDFEMVKVLFGRVDIKHHKMEEEFQTIREVIDPMHNEEHGLRNEVHSNQVERPVDLVELKRKSARERFLERKKQK
ncbi:DEAH-box ATP-dependent RNA helicase prp22 [Boothiomyces sp. JEL0838]|nr:DEAH-box ATP-dependent RNA helicase prp22 [Boothiomyces sp. JEL0838]